jgi:hypothetical protein
MGFLVSFHDYRWVWVSVLLFRIIHYQNVAIRVKKFEGKSGRGVACLSEGGACRGVSFA